MGYASRVVGKPILPAEAFKLTKITNTSTAIVRYEPTFMNTIWSLESYSRAFMKGYGVGFVDVCITDITEDRISFKFLDVNFGATYIDNVKVGKMMVKHQGLLPLF